MVKDFEGFRAGEIVDGRYEIIDTIGQGGFGVVYRARQIAIDRVVALKVLLPEADTVDPQAVERFRREAVLISSLESPNTITLYEFGQTNTGLLYTVMEFARGDTLRQVLAREHSLPAHRVVHICAQVLQSLFEAHQRGIIHRDLKPANIMVGEYAGQHDHVKVLDFGIAKILKSGDTQSTLALTGRIVGTPRYMAPEQLRGANPTPACDLYALGLVMFEMLTGGPAVTASDPMEQVQAQMRPEPFALPSNTPGVTPAMVNILNRVLDKEPAKRFQSADVFRKALQGATKISVPSDDMQKTKQVDPQAILAAQAVAQGMGQPHQAAPMPVPAAKPAKSSLGLYIVVAALFFLLALGGLAFMLVFQGGKTETPDRGGDTTRDTGGATQRDTGGVTERDAGTTYERDTGGVSSRDTGVSPTTDTTVAPEDDVIAAADTTVTPPETDAGLVVPRVDTGGSVEEDTGTVVPDMEPEAVDTGPVVVDMGQVPEPDVEDDVTIDVVPTTPDAPVATDVEETEDTASVTEDATQPGDTVALEIATTPARVRIYRGDDDCRAPCTIQVPADGTSVRIRLRKTGYESQTRDVSAADAPRIEFILQREAEEPDGSVIDIIL